MSVQPIVSSPALPAGLPYQHLSNVKLSPWAERIDKLFKPIQQSRGLELFVIDVFGFMLIRTILDTFRQYIFTDTIDKKRHVNKMSGRERFLMELTGMSQILVGPMALLMGLYFDQNRRAFSNKHTPIETIELFQDLVKSPEVRDQSTFFQALAKRIDAGDAGKIADWLQHGVENPKNQENVALGIAKHLNLSSMDVTLGKQPFSLDTLMRDVRVFFKTLEGQTGHMNWQEQAQKVLKNTLHANWIRIPVSMGLMVAGVASFPHLIHVWTKKVDHMADYPGELGLRKLNETVSDENKNFFQRVFPFLSDSVEKGNYKPLGVLLAPLPLLALFFNMDKVVTEGLAKAFIKPGKGFFKNLAKTMQFLPEFPFIQTAQVALTYATTVYSRILTSRNAVEFRERLIDGFLAWSIWMLATPFLKNLVSKLYDKGQQTQILKKVGNATVMKSRKEIEHLISDSGVMRKTLNKFIPIGPASVVATMLLLGLLEPYFSIRLTEWQSKWIQRRQGARQKASGNLSDNASFNSPAGNIPKTVTPQPTQPEPVAVPRPFPSLDPVSSTVFSPTLPAFSRPNLIAPPLFLPVYPSGGYTPAYLWRQG